MEKEIKKGREVTENEVTLLLLARCKGENGIKSGCLTAQLP